MIPVDWAHGLPSDDADEASYDIPLSGAGTTPEITLEQPAGTAIGNSAVAWGSNLQGQTNVPAGLTDLQAIAVGAFHTVALKSDGTVVS